MGSRHNLSKFLTFKVRVLLYTYLSKSNKINEKDNQYRNNNIKISEKVLDLLISIKYVLTMLPKLPQILLERYDDQCEKGNKVYYYQNEVPLRARE